MNQPSIPPFMRTGRNSYTLNSIDEGLFSAPPLNNNAQALPLNNTQSPAVGGQTNGLQRPILSVAEFTRTFKNVTEQQFRDVWLRGEISNFKPAPSGHLYFSLKDSEAQISAVCFKGIASKLKFALHEGLELIVHGKVSIYEARGNYQIILDYMEPLGKGALQLAFEQLKQKLQKSGLFAADKKKAIPSLAKRIGVVTSPTGAAIQDIIQIATRRNPNLQLILFPSAVQGEGAPLEIANAIDEANRLCGPDGQWPHKKIDVLIVGRGGGSIEDLWAFNTEIVALAVHRSKIPTIAAVGHETDFTITDFVADFRAPTPSAAAEIAVMDTFTLQFQTAQKLARIGQALKNIIQKLNLKLDHTFDLPKSYFTYLEKNKKTLLALQARLISPSEQLKQNALKLLQLQSLLNRFGPQYFPMLRMRQEQIKTRMHNRVQFLMQKYLNQLRQTCLALDSVSPLKIMDLGYALVRDHKSQTLLKSIHEIKEQQLIDINLKDGLLVAMVQNQSIK